ncbi:MAG: DUF177 domain-containing protein [Thermodesulfobacteriota bacterium]|nr:DUF177 domain-containing protein [Thermodesulfobacteriota bacterium]
MKKIEDIKIDVDTIGVSGIEEDLCIEPAAFEEVLKDEDVHITRPLQIHYEITENNENIYATVHIHGRIDTCCSRCLSPMVYPVDLTLDTQYVPAEDDMPDDLEAEREGPGFGYYRNVIMLGEYIVSEIIVSLPVYYVCDSRCKGLCPICGANLNKNSCMCKRPIDSRFSILKQLKQHG